MPVSELQTYFLKRLTECGLDEKSNLRTVSFEGRPQDIPIIDVDEKNDAIVIPYVQPDGEIEYYLDGKKERAFERLRYRVPRVFTDKEGKARAQKYSQPSGTEILSYLPPAIVKRYKAGKKIKTLYIVEGELKALTASVKLGIDIVGIGGINNYRNKENNKLEPFLISIIDRLKPDNIVLFFDADCLAIKYEQKKELTTRLKAFYGAVCTFSELVKPFECDVYFAHVAEKFIESAKGLDDLLNLPSIDSEDLKNELIGLAVGKPKYISVQPLRGGYADRLASYFHLKDVSDFYEHYKQEIQDNEFQYNGKSYYFDGSKIASSLYLEARQYLRIGCDYYKKIWKLNAHKNIEHQIPMQVLEKWNIGEINRDFGKGNFSALIPKYDAFVNYPDNTDNYKRIIELEHNQIKSVYYNRYNKIVIQPAPGKWQTIEHLLKHIFSSNNTAGENLYQFGLDYLQLSFTTPKQRLPVLCCVSSERNTGKTKFLEFLKLIFGENMAILDNERFTGKFTSHFSDKLFVGLDEGFIPIEQKIMKERIKNFATGATLWCEGKGKESFELDNFAHLIMCSNDETNFMQIDDGENRFAVLKIPVL
ncbi:MAG: DUF5906 domain-containing protein, partial [Paludibacter sp.]|nr:DUF5906 domain-containing protein [Paludibacter sp.]